MFKLLLSIPKDKLLHFIAGMLIAMIVSLFTTSLMVVIGIVVGAGVAKEVIWDAFIMKGYISLLDILATVLGGLIIIIYNITLN